MQNIRKKTFLRETKTHRRTDGFYRTYVFRTSPKKEEFEILR